MNGFQDIRLSEFGDVISIKRGFPTQRATKEGEVPVMSIADLRNQKVPRYFAGFEDMRDLRIDEGQPGDVLVSIEGGTVGEVLSVGPDVESFVPSQQVATLRVTRPDELDPWYLGAWLSSETAQEQLRRLTRGSGIQRIAIKELGSLVLRVPPVEFQRQIGHRFVAFETSIRLHRDVAVCLQDLRDADLVVSFAGLNPDTNQPSIGRKRDQHGG